MKFLFVIIVALSLVACASSPVRLTDDRLLPAITKLFAAPGMPLVDAPSTAKSVVYASMKYSGDLGLDIYYPAGYDFHSPKPFIVLANGIENEEQIEAADGAPFKDLAMTVSWAMAFAASGYPAVTYDSFEKLQGGGGAETAPASTERLLDFLKQNEDLLGIDSSRIGFYSMGGTARGLQRSLAGINVTRQGRVRCAVFNGAVLDPEVFPRQKMPVLIIRPALASPAIVFVIDDWAAELKDRGFNVEVHNNPSGTYNYDTAIDNADTRKAIAKILAFFDEHLRRAIE